MSDMSEFQIRFKLGGVFRTQTFCVMWVCLCDIFTGMKERVVFEMMLGESDRRI